MNKRISLDEAYMQMAEVWSQRSHAVRKKVGAIVVKGNRIIADGYNGTPKGFDNVCEIEVVGINEFIPELVTKPEVLHAESNALLKLANSTESSGGSTLYVTLSPCFECSKLIIQAGINRIVYREEYRITDGIDFLRSAGLEVVKLPNKE